MSSQPHEFKRTDGRRSNELRQVRFHRRFTRYAEGSVLTEFGNTQVLCTCSVEDRVPNFLKGQGQGWVTAEYGMLPRATHTRSDREASRGKQTGRTLEIQRLIGRSLRTVVDLQQLGERTLLLDCDVIQADGGTRTAAITGSMLALHDALNHLVAKGVLPGSPQTGWIAAVSAGILDQQPLLDLCYEEDSQAAVDLNAVMNERGEWIEVQGTAENGQIAMSRPQLNALLDLAESGITQLLQYQQACLHGS